MSAASLLFLSAVPNVRAVPAPSQVVVEVSSGGVSLGSYQGGYLLGRTLRVGDSDLGKPKILTGASAGAINTLGGLYYVFHPISRYRDYSPYAEWLAIDWKGLSEGSLKKPVESLLNTDVIDKRLNQVIDQVLTAPDPLARKEEVQLGFAITRLIPEKVYRELDVKSVAEKITVRFRWLEGSECPDPVARKAYPKDASDSMGQGCYQAWTTGYGLESLGDRRPVNHLWFGETGTDVQLIRENLRSLARASSSFPVAFPPHPIRIFNWDPSQLDQKAVEKILKELDGICKERSGSRNEVLPGGSAQASRLWEEVFANLDFKNTRLKFNESQAGTPGTVELVRDGVKLVFRQKEDSARGRWSKGPPVKFSDGGQFENQPLEFAMRIHEYPGSVARTCASDPSGAVGPIRMLSPTHYRLEDLPPRILRSMSAEWFLILTGYPDATSQEILRALERRDVDSKSIELNTTVLPVASEHILHFSSFFEQRFRRFDFVAGFFDVFDSGTSFDPAHGLPLFDTNEFARRVNSTAGIDDLKWMRRFLFRSAFDGSVPNDAKDVQATEDPKIRASSALMLFVKARYVADTLQKLGNRSVLDESTKRTIRNRLELLDLVQVEIRKAFEVWKDKAMTSSPDDEKALFEDMEVLQVLHASLERMKGTMEAILDGDGERGSDRYSNFLKGLKEAEGWYETRHQRDPPRSNSIHQGSKTSVDDVYLQAARFIEKDALGTGNSFVYPLALYHARLGIGLATGDKPRWSAPYLRVEGANPGFRILQGYSVVPRCWAPLPFFDLLRWEVGLHASWNAEPAQFWLPIRTGIEIPLRSWFSLVPGITWSVPLTDSTRQARLGMDALFADLVHVRMELRKHDRPEISAGLRIGFDPWILSEGLVNGTNKQRILKESTR